MPGRLASDALAGGTIPLGQAEESKGSPPLFLFDGGHLCAAMHGAGINLRYLPMVRPTPRWRLRLVTVGCVDGRVGVRLGGRGQAGTGIVTSFSCPACVCAWARGCVPGNLNFHFDFAPSVGKYLAKNEALRIVRAHSHSHMLIWPSLNVGVVLCCAVLGCAVLCCAVPCCERHAEPFGGVNEIAEPTDSSLPAVHRTSPAAGRYYTNKHQVVGTSMPRPPRPAFDFRSTCSFETTREIGRRWVHTTSGGLGRVSAPCP